MHERPLRTTVIGSYPFPGWLELATAHLDELGPDDVAELQDDAVLAAVHDQVAAGLDVISDGEQSSRAAASARRRTTSETATVSSASSPLRAGSARWRSSSACAASRRPAPS
jgi:hypothetical protein